MLTALSLGAMGGGAGFPLPTGRLVGGAGGVGFAIFVGVEVEEAVETGREEVPLMPLSWG